MPVDKFGRMSDNKTRDTVVSLTYINNNYIRSDGGTSVSGSINMNGNTLYNVSDPVNPQDVATKEYVDNTKGTGVIGEKSNDGFLVTGNLDFAGKYKLQKLPPPVEGGDAVPRVYVDTATVDLKLDIQKDQAFVFREKHYQAKNVVNMRGNQIKKVGEPQENDDAATKKFVSDLVDSKTADAAT